MNRGAKSLSVSQYVSLSVRVGRTDLLKYSRTCRRTHNAGFQVTASLAKGTPIDARDIQGDGEISQGRIVWAYQPNAARMRFHSCQYRRRMWKVRQCRAWTLLADFNGIGERARVSLDIGARPGTPDRFGLHTARHNSCRIETHD